MRLLRLLNLILILGIAASTRAAESATPACPSDLQFLPELDSELRARTADDRFSGAVLIAKDGIPVFREAYGYADREATVVNDLNTKFRFGSMGKMFTGVAVLQLVEAGRVRLDDPLGNYLPDYPNRDVAAVTIHQLLTHTAGTGDIFGPEFDAHRLELRELADYVALYGNRGLLFPPGSRFEYSNYGYILLGRVIEVVSGQTYYAYVRDHIFRPAGMRFTGNQPEEENVPKLAIPYTAENPGPGPGTGPGPAAVLDSGLPIASSLRSAVDLLPYRGNSAGGGYSTVGDLAKFVRALMSYRFLTPHYTDLAITGQVDTPRPGTRYAYGFEDSVTPAGVRFFGNDGGAPGMNGSLWVYPDSGDVVIVLANLDPPAAIEIDQFIRARLPLD